MPMIAEPDLFQAVFVVLVSQRIPIEKHCLGILENGHGLLFHIMLCLWSLRELPQR